MKVYYDELLEYKEPRLHPYKAGNESKTGYIDFKAYPGLITEVLEDFNPFNHWSAIQKFYEVLKQINGVSSYLETSDCQFRGPTLNKDRISDLKLRATGRLFLLFRDLQLNCSNEHSNWLCQRLLTVIDNIDSELTEKAGVIGFSLCPILHVELSNGSWDTKGKYHVDGDDPGYGFHLMLSFWAYGDDEAMVNTNLYRIFENIGSACQMLNEEIIESQG